MNAQTMTQQEIRLSGIQLLSQHMGITGMIRFLQQTEMGYGNYTKERGDILGNPNIEDLATEIQESKWNKKI